MSFPVSPANGATTTINGITYVYSSTNNSWTINNTSLITVSTSAPSGPQAGSLWYKSDEGGMKIYYTDADSSQWVDIAIAGPTGPSGTTTFDGGAPINNFSSGPVFDAGGP